MCAFQTACKGDIIRNKKCVKRANGTDAYSKGTDKFYKGTDKKSMGIAKLPSSLEIPNADFELTCKKCNTTRLVDSVNGKVKIKKSGSKYVLAKCRRYHCPSCNGDMAAKSIKKL